MLQWQHQWPQWHQGKSPFIINSRDNLSRSCCRGGSLTAVIQEEVAAVVHSALTDFKGQLLTSVLYLGEGPAIPLSVAEVVLPV